jgi:myotubularin-related protein 10/11/12
MMKSGFTSYITGLSDEEKDASPPVMADLLPGEMVISSAGSVCYFSTVSGNTSGQTGSLFVTTLKLSFKQHLVKDSSPRRGKNKLLTDTDISLSSIHSIYEISGENGERRKKLTLGSNITNRVDGLFIVCKNFKFFRFSFKFSSLDQGRNITNALLHHSRPKKNDLLFAFEHSLHQRPHTAHSTVWPSVLTESGCPGHRVCLSNETWLLCNTLSQQFVVPGHVTDNQLAQLAAVGAGSRPPVWAWGTRTGGSIYIQPALAVTSSPAATSLTSEYYSNVYNITVKDLDKILPSQQQLEESLVTMLDLHCVETTDRLQEVDSKYLSQLEESGWPATVAHVLRLAVEVCEIVTKGSSVVLQEGEGRSTSLLVSSVAELLLEKSSRTRVGFQRLVQKNWVSLGFPFSRSHALSGSSGSNVNPVFLIFLDCVYQVGVQFPASLEFTECYLRDVWDTAFLPIFDTFIFNSEHDRAVARAGQETPLLLHSAWQWEQQFDQEYIDSWENPLECGVPIRPPRRNASDPSEASMIMSQSMKQTDPESKKYLPVVGEVSSLTTWYKMFHRSVPGLQVKNSGEDEITATRMEAKKTIINCTRYNTSTHKGNNRVQH